MRAYPALIPASGWPECVGRVSQLGAHTVDTEDVVLLDHTFVYFVAAHLDVTDALTSELDGTTYAFPIVVRAKPDPTVWGRSAECSRNR